MTQIAVQVSQGGRIVIPADIRLKMGVNIGDQVLLNWSEEAHELRIATRKQRLKNALDLVKCHAQASDDVVGNFLRERRLSSQDE
ncbi:AbrB/MazE/SpoVT family DNA-binding domain-containing protein [Ferrovum sp.]|jgi:AbrB family looped-hinge helix DNA binding protein|uniref:AbrB/MazE/SpoVT family DNA-binding domain-containing protein n=1 Tax=Ferrovum sp. TaxID=2609467 RepID=UPI00260F91A8|nr:AbrB/MazE/SpoVT family DNA-binding domain-containing protein [Ferrovum sp.]